MASRLCIAVAKTGTDARVGMRGWRRGESLGIKLRSEMARTLGSGVRAGSTMRSGIGFGFGFGMRFQRRGLLTESCSAGPNEVIGFISSFSFPRTRYPRTPFIYLQSLITTKLTTRSLSAATSPAYYSPTFPQHRQLSW